MIVIPCYNHAATVARVIDGIRGTGLPILVVDDGSTDGGGEAARAAGAEVIGWPVNRGKGAALAAALRHAQDRGCAWAVACDADGQHPPEAILTLIGAARRDPAALHIGVRDMRAAPMASRIGRSATAVGGLLACGRWLPDNQSGLRSYPLPAALALQVPASRYAFEICHAVQAVRAGIRIMHHQVPVFYPTDRVSHFRSVHDTIRTAAALVRCRLRRPVAPTA